MLEKSLSRGEAFLRISPEYKVEKAFNGSFDKESSTLTLSPGEGMILYLKK